MDVRLLIEKLQKEDPDAIVIDENGEEIGHVEGDRMLEGSAAVEIRA